MNSAAIHYDTHLGPIYAWMIGNLRVALARSSAELEDMGLPSAPRLKALDLGAGLGLHSVALAKRGFSVTAIDSCRILLDQLPPQAAELRGGRVAAELGRRRADRAGHVRCNVSRLCFKPTSEQ
jgi:hypothetical protein